MKKLTYVLLVLALSGCGIQKLAEDTRDEVRHTNDNLNISNDKQTQLLEATKKLTLMTSDLLKGINTTNNAVHLQVLTVALQQLLSPENTETLTPPVRMFPYAEVFTKEATADEILQTVHVFLADVEKGGTTPAEKPTEKDLRIVSRHVSLAAAGLIAAFIPADKLKTILETQVEKTGGDFENTAYKMCVLRYQYIRDLFLGSLLDAESAPRVNMSIIKRAAGYFASLKEMTHLAYVDRLKFTVKTFDSVTNPETKEVTFKDRTLTVNPKELSRVGAKAISRFNQDATIKSQLESTPEGQALAKQFQD